MLKQDRYWFAAKSYGIGWTLPVSWQGWVTVLLYLGLIAAGAGLIETRSIRLTVIVVATLVLIAIVAWKGEKPVRWRRG